MNKILTLFFPLLFSSLAFAGTYQISGSFNGCEDGKYYPISGYNLLLKCEEYNYFYEYMPTVETDGSRVTTIGNQRIQASLVDGEVIETNISGDFQGCDYDKTYKLDNGLVFVCSTYSYSYSHRPEVKIIKPSGGYPTVYIGDDQHDGWVY